MPDGVHSREDGASYGEGTPGASALRASRTQETPVQPWAVPTPTPNAPSRKVTEREMDDPEGNLVIGERVGHESQRRFPYWEYGWVGTAHSTEQHCIWHATHADACAPIIAHALKPLNDLQETIACDIIQYLWKRMIWR